MKGLLCYTNQKELQQNRNLHNIIDLRWNYMVKKYGAQILLTKWKCYNI